MSGCLTVVLAGGKGSRLGALSRDRAKPAVPFGGQYRIIDFTLSNCVNSNLRRILVLTQYKAASLDRHLRDGWNFLPAEMGEFLDVVPPQQRLGEEWYQGTADAIYQNVYRLEREPSDEILVLGGDHVYRMDYRPMLDFHRRRRAALTIACVPVPLAEATRFGVVQCDDSFRVTGFEEKIPHPTPMPGEPGLALASMGLYAFATRTLFDRLMEDAVVDGSSRDFGHDVIPRMIEQGEAVYAYPFHGPAGQPGYWRDVGTLDDYYAANLDLVRVTPALNLYDTAWPVRTAAAMLPPAKFVHDTTEDGRTRRGAATDSIVGPGCVVSGGGVARSVLGPQVRVNSFAEVHDSVLLGQIDIGRGARVRNAIIDKGVRIGPGVTVGHDRAADADRGLHFSDGGVVLVPKGETLE